MPEHAYTCEVCGLAVHELFLGSEEVWEAAECPRCAGRAPRAKVNRFRHIGLVHEGVDEATATFLTAAERKSGKQIRTPKQLRQAEERAGVRPMEASEVRYARQAEVHDMEMITRAAREGGAGAALDYVDDTNITSATGWDQTQLRRWQEATDAVGNTLDLGGTTPSDAVGAA